LFVKDLISNDVPELSLGDEPVNALNLMDEFKVSHLPVLDGTRFVGLVSEEELELLGTDPQDKLIREQDILDIHVSSEQHVYDVLRLFSEHRLTVVPVVDNGAYLGSITITQILDSFAKSQAVSDPGGVIVLELNAQDYSLQEIAGIVEGNDAKILSSFLSTSPTSMQVEVTLKINQEDLSGILQTFARYDYQVKASYQESRYEDDLKNRYDEFMKYLNM
jgi:acetoin utilization protein AcuB